MESSSSGPVRQDSDAERTRGLIDPEQLARWNDYGGTIADQMATLAALDVGPMSTPIAYTSPHDPSASWEKRMRGYMHANCSHCHNPKGAARTSGLHLDPHTPVSIAYGLCKPPVAAGGGTGGRLEDIHPGSPEKSVLSYRVGSDKPGDMMPELGRTLVHREGLELLNRWIASLPGDC